MLKNFAPGSNRPTKTCYQYSHDPADAFPSGRNWLGFGETYLGSQLWVYRHIYSGQTRFYRPED